MIDDLYGFDAEHPADALTRKQRAAIVNSGERSPMDGPTDLERLLLMRIRQMGRELLDALPAYSAPVRKSA